MTIFLDLETDGLLRPDPCSLQHQPHILEICAIKTDNELNVKDYLKTLLNPGIPIPEHITKINRITDQMIKDQLTFPLFYDTIANFFLGESVVVAHNASFDMGVILIELLRIDKQYNFPWPINRICTVEKSLHIKNRRLKLNELYEMATGKDKIENHHSAHADVGALIECYKFLVKNGEI